ncbi:hypothetical protein RFEPED_0757 [Rickettsia felis str. Pedreira]|uniref:Toxin n=2 Tax=Rickettsia felis TaxID=42862 RepID=A0A0F3MRU7_RICFI|nr:hypothetical protein [Rickettsia felis]AAY61163.1 unknown [Rickettsia felis URRWXCal2]KHO04028.1 hypothetical protein JS61_01760 [Rickettsia felis]KJV58376.1 hypothetical protein RFEPED_0757 [Rickettsia felis str. Pedreira]MDE8612050.1 hypothetical protein [Rickettsia felis]
MTKFRYNHEKNAKLLLERNIGFDEIIQSINDGNLLGAKLHHDQEKYKGQQILYVKIIDQVYAVPFVEEEDNTIFLKTLYPSRKAKKEFLGNNTQ